MNAPPVNHPSATALRDFTQGRLDDASVSAVFAHLEVCPDCRRAAEQVSAGSLLVRIRGLRSGADTSAVSEGITNPGVGRPATPATVIPAPLATHSEYEVLRELGRGGMGVVYLARNRRMGREEVLKVMSRQIADNPGVGERFLQEIQAVARLSHPNIVTAYSAPPAGDLLVLAMEYVEGEDLAKLVRANGPLPVQHACYYVQQAANGLQHAFEKGMAHRDIKPHNLILHRAGKKHTVKILDFGLAKLAGGKDRPGEGLTQLGQALGTPEYMAPEQIEDASSADIRADIYALGCTLYFLLTGRPPFQASSLFGLIGQHLTQGAPPVHELRTDVPAELSALVARTLEKKPAARFQTPAEMAAALQPFVRTRRYPTDGSAPVPPSAPAANGMSGVPDSPQAAPPVEVEWGTLVDGTMAVAERPRAFAKPPRKSDGVRALRWTGIAAGTVFAALMVAGAAGAFRVKTKYGTLVIENVPTDAEVLVDGDRVTITDNTDEVTVQSVREGQHTIKVIQNGVVVFARDDVRLTVVGESVRVRVEAAMPKSRRAAPKADGKEEDRTSSNGEPAPPSGKASTGVLPNAPTGVPPKKIEATIPAKPTRRGTVESGTWKTENGELTGFNSQGPPRVWFGDPSWTDYDFSFSAMRDRTNPSVNINCFFRAQDPNNRLAVTLGSFGNSYLGSDSTRDGVWNGIVGVKWSLEAKKWYDVRIHIRGSSIQAFIDGKSMISGSNGYPPRGGVGFGGGKEGTLHFRNIKVSDASGGLLWEGLPELANDP